MFVTGTDDLETNVLGAGPPASNMEQQIFYTLDSTLTNFDPYAATTTWVRIKGAELTATKEAGETPYYDQFEELGTKRGRITTNFEIKQSYTGYLQSIKTLDNQLLWYAEGIQDDRAMEDVDGNPIFHEVHFYKAKLTTFTDDKGDLYTTTGKGKFDSSLYKVIFKAITPVNIAISGSDNAATSGTPETYIITGTDLYGSSIDLTDISAAVLQGEISSISIEKVSGTPTISVVDGVDDTQKLVTFTGAGECVVRAKIVTAHGGTYYSSNKTVTVTS